jgi:hypothetical protein
MGTAEMIFRLPSVLRSSFIEENTRLQRALESLLTSCVYDVYEQVARNASDVPVCRRICDFPKIPRAVKFDSQHP